jgi:thiamine-monophosphate kinase
MDEFAWIDGLLRPLAGSPEARGLLDDVAVVPSRSGFDLVLTKDALVEGVHFLPDDPLDLVARKLLRVNLSDLAAKGADPYAYLLAIAWPPRCGGPERAAFAEGLRLDQAAYGLTLLGGDTVSTPGPLTASVTMLGWVPEGGTVSRAGAQAGDGLYVTGPIGDAGLGLRAARGELDALGPEAVARLSDRYRLPRPRTDVAERVRAVATASADVSDGLLADAGHIAAASGVAVSVDLRRVPLSPDARAWLEAPDAERVAELAALGDDYEVVFTARPECAAAAEAVAVRIGDVSAGAGLTALWDGASVALTRLGWRHA